MPLAGFPREQIGDRTYHLKVEGPGTETLMACCTMRLKNQRLTRC
jgi:hypothetical protein